MRTTSNSTAFGIIVTGLVVIIACLLVVVPGFDDAVRETLLCAVPNVTCVRVVP
jgi:UPF0716 family protein affecting phage T7 exclusion